MNTLPENNNKKIQVTVRYSSMLFEKICGLIGKKNPYPLLLITRFGIHTFGVRFPIDLIILNNKNRVVGLKENLLPNKIFLWNPRYSIIVELPEGTIKKKNIHSGDEIKLDVLEG